MEFYNQFKENITANIPLDLNDPIDSIKEEYKHCIKCYLCNNRKEGTSVIFGEGVYSPLLCIIGLSPSNYDNEIGKPFSDIIGQKIQGIIKYLSRYLNLINNIYCTNLVMCPGNVTQNEIEQCSERLNKELEVVNPKYILLLGGDVSKILDCKDIDFLRLKRHVVSFDKFYPTYVTYGIKDLFYRADEVRLKVKEDLDFVVKECLKKS